MVLIKKLNFYIVQSIQLISRYQFKCYFNDEKKFNLEIGYSDHSPGSLVPSFAVSMGASIIEKHLTLDKNMIGPDHAASLTPSEFKKMVENIRTTEVSLGSGIKKPSKSS